MTREFIAQRAFTGQTGHDETVVIADGRPAAHPLSGTNHNETVVTAA